MTHGEMRRRIPPVQRPSRRPSVPVARSRHRLARPNHRLLERLPNNQHTEQAAAEASPVGSALGTAEQRAKISERHRRFRPIHRRGRSRAAVIAEQSLLTDADFRMLWLSRLLSQTGQGALLYAMLILVVDLSDRTIYSSLFVLCSILPSLLFGLPAGVVVDAVPRRGLLVILNLLRFTFMLFIVSAAEPSLGDVFAATLGIWVIHQFYAPAEASVMGAIVPSRRYTSAQALFNLALTIAQALGLVLLAPLLLRAGGPRTVFAAAGLLFMVAGLLAVLLPAVGRAEKRHLRSRLGIRDILAEGWRFAKGDRPTLEAILDDVLVGIGMSALVVIVPFYLERVLNTSKENTVFVFAPAALGLVLGLRLAPALGKLLGERMVATGSLFIFAASVGALGFVEQLHDLLTAVLRLPLDQISDLLSISPLILVAMMISIPAGFASALVNVAARSILLSRTPERVRGQVIATQGLIGNIGALAPTLLAGIATDIFGVQPIAVAIALMTMLVALAAHAWGRRPPVPVETASLA